MFTAVGIAVVVVLAWLVIATVWLWRNQERVVFQPPAVVPPDPAGARRVPIRATDGIESYSYVVAPEGGAASGTVVLAFHGNADLAAWLVPWARELVRRTGATVVVPEYRGYGGVPGSPSYRSAGSDASGALQYALSLKPRRLVLFGHSLGTAIAAELAAAETPAPDALVLQSPFSSARDMAARMLIPAIPGLWARITRVHYDTRARVAALDVPIFVAHGTLDITIPPRMGRDVFAAARRPGELLLVQGAGHNDVADVGGETYWRWLVDAVTGVSAPVGELEQQRGGRLP